MKRRHVVLAKTLYIASNFHDRRSISQSIPFSSFRSISTDRECDLSRWKTPEAGNTAFSSPKSRATSLSPILACQSEVCGSLPCAQISHSVLHRALCNSLIPYQILIISLCNLLAFRENISSLGLRSRRSAMEQCCMCPASTALGTITRKGNPHCIYSHVAT